MRIHQSELYHMRGSGVGAIFSSIFRNLIPIASSVFGLGKQVLETKAGQKVLQAVKRPALQAGLDIASDALEGENVLKSIKKRGKQAGAKVVENVLTGKGGKGGKGKGGKGSRGKGAAKKRGAGGKKKKKKSSPAPPAKRARRSGPDNKVALSLMSQLGL